MAASHLPKNYGGDLPEIDYTGADWYPAIVKYEDNCKGKVLYFRKLFPKFLISYFSQYFQ